MSSSKPAVAVFCGASLGKHQAYANAARSVGQTLAADNRPLVYGGGSRGIMGVVSGAALAGGGKVTGVMPRAMLAAGGEKEKVESIANTIVDEEGREKIEMIMVTSMHERKVEMEKRVNGFIGLPGGFGTFEEVMEATTWTQLGIHNKPVVLINVRSFWEPLRQLIKSGVSEGFIKPANEKLVVFVEGPDDMDEHEMFDWGSAALKALDEWSRGEEGYFDWSSAGTEEQKLILT